MIQKLPGNLKVALVLIAGWNLVKNFRKTHSKESREKKILEEEVIAELTSRSSLDENMAAEYAENGFVSEETLNSPAGALSPRSKNSKLHLLVNQLKELVEEDGGFPICAIVNGDLDRSLLRFLVAADFSVAKARENVASMKKWREENDIDHILRWILPDEKLDALRRCMPSSYHGNDKEGHPIHLEQTGHFNWEILRHCSADDLVKMHILFMEYQSRVLFPRASAMKGHTVDRMTNILDLKGLNIRVLSNLHALNIFKEVQRIDQQNYPGMLHTTYIVNANWVFRAVWNVLKICFPARDHKKMRMVPPGAKGLKILKEAIPEEHIPRFLGGNCDCRVGCVSGPAGSGSNPSDYQAKMLKDLNDIRTLFNNSSDKHATDKYVQRFIRISSIDPERKLKLEYTESVIESRVE